MKNGYEQQAAQVLNRVREPNRNYPSFRILLARVRTDMLFAYGQLNQKPSRSKPIRPNMSIYHWSRPIRKITRYATGRRCCAASRAS
jgi:hypothetical protein